MKKVYKNIDSQRVNKSNLESIKAQFNDWVFKETDDLLGVNKKKPKKKLADVRFQREYSSNPNTKVRYMDRPEYILNNSESSEVKNNSMDNYFQPLGVNTNSTIKTNYKAEKSISTVDKLNQIEQLRTRELPNQSRPKTPDFLKPEKVGKEVNDYEYQNADNNNDNFKVLDFKNPSTDIYNGLEGNNSNVGSFINGNESNGDLFSIDNIDTPLTKMEMVEDSSSFEDRLKRLQMDRDNLKMPNKNFDRNNIKMSNQVNAKSIEREIPRKNNVVKRESLFSEDDIYSKPEERVSLFSEEDNNQVKKIAKKITRVDDNVGTYKKMIDLLRKEVEILKSKNNDLQNELNKGNNNAVGSDDLRRQIIDEWKKLEEKNSVIDINLKLLQQKELELVNKEEEIKKLMASYNYMFMTRYLQLEVSSENNSSSYSYQFNRINNIVGIKLLSYSLAQSRYNITNSNNKLTLIQDEDESIIILDNGYYTITDLIEILNKKSNLKFELSINQKVKVSAENNFSIKESILLNKVLGFEDKLEDSNEYIAENIYDLRVDNKVYLYLKNLNNTEPFGVLHFHGQSICEFKLNNPINLDYLEIEFRDSDNNLYNFYNLPHYLSFQLEVVKNNYESVSL